MEKTLCRPCAEGFGSIGKIKALTGKAVKITCDACGRRRFGLRYEVEEKKPAVPRLDANKTSLYKLVSEFQVLPTMSRTRFSKTPRTRSWWLRWDGGGEICEAYLSESWGDAVLSIRKKDWDGVTTYQEAFRLPVDKLREPGMIE